MKEFAYRLLFLLVASLVMKALISDKVRNKITPYVFAFSVAAPSFGTALQGLPAVICIALGYLSRAFLLDGCQFRWMRNNPIVGALVVLWLYMMSSMMFGDFSGYAFAYYLYVFFDSVMVGYFVGMWVLRNPGEWARLLRILTVAAAICLVFYTFHGVFSTSLAEEMGGGRATISVEKDGELVVSNQNYVGLLVVALLPYPFLLIMGRHSDYAKHAWIKFVAYITFILMAAALVRTGSRNASLGLLPILAYLFFAKTALDRSKKMALRVAIVISVLVTLAFSTGALDKLRIITAASESGDITSGRLDSFIVKLYGSTETQKWFGRGCLYDLRFYEELGLKTPPMSNGHSMYFQILYQSGYVGVFLLFVLISAVWIRSKGMGTRGHLIRLLFFIWAFCGVAESMPLLQEGVFKPLMGMALAFCTKLRLPGMYQIEGASPYPPPYPYPLPYYG